MRVLLVNNRSGGLGGAETVVAETERLLHVANHDPVPFMPDRVPNQAGVYSFRARRAVEDVVRRVRPHVAHVHNAYEVLTLSVVDGLSALGVPIVMTLHDYRAVCPNGYLLAHDGPCLRCPISGSVASAVTHRCVGNSVRRSLVAAAECSVNRRRHRYTAPRVLIAPSRFLRRVMVIGGLPGEQIRVVPNPVRMQPFRHGLPDPPRFVYAGRLVEQKGLDVLLDASAMLEPPATVTVCGMGRFEEHVRQRVDRERLPVEIRGHLTRPAVVAELAQSTAAILPSLWFENCPMVVLEAGACGVATIASDLGALPEIVTDNDTGVLVPPADPRALAVAMNRLSRSPDIARAFGERARKRARQRHDPNRYLNAVLSAYADAIAA